MSSSLAALVLLAPLLLVIAIAIKLGSPGPAFFEQSRIGRRGERLSMLKFRSMAVGAEQMQVALKGRNEAEGGLFKITDDPRRTRIGGVLRRTSLDGVGR